MQAFTYQKAMGLEEASRQILTLSGQAAFLAGGTDLLVQIKEKRKSPQTVIDLKTIEGLSGLKETTEQIQIGALTTIRAVETCPLINSRLPLLAQAASKLGSVQVRNRATIGGNLCNAAPSAETAPALLALDALVEIKTQQGTKEIPLSELFKGPGQTILEPGEILTAIKIALSQNPQGAIYYKLSNRKAMDIAFVGVAVLLELDGEIISKARIALGAVAPTPLRATKAEQLLQGQKLTTELAQQAAQLTLETAQPITDLRATKEYRQQMVKNLSFQGLLTAYDQAKKG